MGQLLKKCNCPLILLQAFTALRDLMLNQLEFAISIMNAHSKSNTPIMKVLSNQLGIFMMRIVAGRFARHVMNTYV
jgi:hypothetical protein